jgi:hypothetical protein
MEGSCNEVVPWNKHIMTQEQLQNFLISYTVDRMAEYLICDFKLGIHKALDIVYNSTTYDLLNKTDNGLYSQSPAYVYEYLKSEYETGALK